VSWDDLGQATSLDVTNFDEAGIKEKDIGWVEGNAFSGTFPFDGPGVTAWVTVFVDVKSEFWDTRLAKVNSS
jgi:hypothetical protein